MKSLAQNLLWFLPLCCQIVYSLQQDAEETNDADDADEGYNFDQQGDDWGGVCQTGQSQSPIELLISESIIQSTPRIRFYNYRTPFRSPLSVVNNGHTANVNLPVTRTGQRAYINGGLLPGNFEVQSVHFHWGSNRTRGSEHTINRIRYDVEMHIVHKNSRYPTMDEATQNSDGLAVLGVLFRSVPRARNHYGLDKIINLLPSIRQYQSSAMIQGQLTANDLLANIATGMFYSYNGSLTTPPCSEAVTWTVFANILDVSQRQIMKFFNLLDDRGLPLLNNYRNLQQLNGRPIYYRSLNFI